MKVGDFVRIKPNTRFAHQCTYNGKIIKHSPYQVWWVVSFENGYENSYQNQDLDTKEDNVLNLLKQIDNL